MAGRKSKRGGGRSEMSFGERMAALRASRAHGGGGGKARKKTAAKRSASTRSSTRSKKGASCTLAACRQLLARAEASAANAARRKAERAFHAGAPERHERALSRMMGPHMLFGHERRQHREPAHHRELGRFEGTFEERMARHGGRHHRVEGPLSPAHDPGGRRRKKRGGHKKARRSGARDASLMDMRDYGRGHSSRSRHHHASAHRAAWLEGYAHASRPASRGRHRRGNGEYAPLRRVRDASYASYDSGYDRDASYPHHLRAGRSRRRAGHSRLSGRDAAYDWPGESARHATAAKKGWRRRHACASPTRRSRRDEGYSAGRDREYAPLRRVRDAAYDWPGESARHATAAKKGWRRRNACASPKRRRSRRDEDYAPRLSGRDTSYDWPGESARHAVAARKGWRRRQRCAPARGRSRRDASYDRPYSW